LIKIIPDQLRSSENNSGSQGFRKSSRSQRISEEASRRLQKKPEDFKRSQKKPEKSE
jgi:hypothetical protein